MAPTHPKLASHRFLAEMFDDPYFPDPLVERGAQVLRDLCGQLEDLLASGPPADADVLALTHAATEKFNDLQEDFYAADSEIETAARECIAEDFWVILDAYGLGHLDVEEVIAPRDW